MRIPKMILRVVFTFLFCFPFFLIAQNYQWAFNIGNNSADLGYYIYTDNNGNVYVTGYFVGTNVDFDPSAGTAFLSSSAGSRDGFVAKYTVTGQYIWAFKIGGSNLDAVQGISADGAGNIYITGYFRGSGVDFDPGPGTAIFNSNGESGSDPGYGGDIFIAKYNSAGQYQWAFNIGGTNLGDAGMVIVCDSGGNVYTGGYFRESPDFDPSSSTQILTASTGTMYVAKYNTNGQYQWAFNLGQGDVDNAPFGIKIDVSSNIYLTGFFQGTNIDFNPSPTVASNLNSNGSFDVFVAKYNATGQYQWAFSIGGPNLDVGRDVEIDNSGNVFVVGDFNGNNIDFDPSPTGTFLLSSNNYDVFVARYNSSGQFQWAKRYGGSGNDISWSIAYTLNHIYITGSFQNTINFDPAGTDIFTSNGANDFYLTKFDINGNYVCAFTVGGSGNDDGYRIDADNSGNLYVTGILSSVNTDFNPSPSVTNNLSTNGSSDIFVAKYDWPENSLPAGTLSGNTICSGGQGQLTFTASTGTAPFIIQYNDGTNTYTQTNVQSGIPFNVAVNPTITTTYTLVSIKGSERCPSVNYPTGITATINVNAAGIADFGYSQSVCNPKNFQFFNTSQGATTYDWNFGDGQTNIGNPNPTVTYAVFGSYNVKFKINTSGGCLDSVVKLISVSVLQDNLIIGNDTTICEGKSLQLNIPNTGLNYCWSPSSTVSTTNPNSPVVTPITNTTYYFTSQSIGSNLVVNGDFSAGNTSFTSDYVPQFPNTTEGQYWVDNNPVAWNGGLINCTEHTTGSGKMMMVNGSPVANAKIWSQTISVSQNTNYAFSAWIQSLHSSNPAQLKFSINGNPLAGNIAASSTACQWNNFFATWNSGNNTSITITIINNNTIAAGNDFALDDIFFGPVFIKQDSIRVSITPPPNIRTGNDTTICMGRSVQLNASGGSVYNWTPATGLTNPNVANPVATPNTTTQYVVSGYNVAGCDAKDSVIISVSPPPVFAINPSLQSICELKQFSVSANGGNSYQWYSNILGNLGNTSSISLTAIQNDTLFVIVNDNICQLTDTLSSIVIVKNNPGITLTKSNDVDCTNPQARLMATGGNYYSWTPAASMSNPNISNPFVFPSSDTWYKVTVTNSDGCSTRDSIQVLTDFAVGSGGFYVPSAFTPNKDGKNDCFGVRFWGAVQTFEFWIYNRWGQVVFYTKNLQDCWDGTLNGQVQSSGVYVYQIKANSVCSPVPVYRKGLVTLIR